MVSGIQKRSLGQFDDLWGWQPNTLGKVMANLLYASVGRKDGAALYRSMHEVGSESRGKTIKAYAGQVLSYCFHCVLHSSGFVTRAEAHGQVIDRSRRSNQSNYINTFDR